MTDDSLNHSLRVACAESGGVACPEHVRLEAARLRKLLKLVLPPFFPSRRLRWIGRPTGPPVGIDRAQEFAVDPVGAVSPAGCPQSPIIRAAFERGETSHEWEGVPV